MNFKSKKFSLIILALTAIVCSRIMFVFFDDPEGPNLLVVVGTALVVCSLSLVVYLLNLSGPKKLLLAIFLQIIIVIGLYFCLN